MSIPENELWQDVFDSYKTLECLWKSTDNDFKNKHLRNAAWSQLLEKYKLIDKNGTIEKLKQKIHNVRSVYRRELKKIRDSEKSGAGMDDVYIPSLWYFDTLEFLRDYETPVPGITTIEIADELDICASSSSLCSKKPRLNAKTEGNRTDFLQKAVSHLEQVQRSRDLRDDASVYSEAWACSFRALSPYQQIYAKQAVDEILIHGRLERLTVNYLPSLYCPNSDNSRTSTPFIATPPSLSPQEDANTQVFTLSDGSYAIPVVTQMDDGDSQTFEEGQNESVAQYFRCQKF